MHKNNEIKSGYNKIHMQYSTNKQVVRGRFKRKQTTKIADRKDELQFLENVH